jgi:hypothetical protein
LRSDEGAGGLDNNHSHLIGDCELGCHNKPGGGGETTFNVKF